jgi:hypothetical protein
MFVSYEESTYTTVVVKCFRCRYGNVQFKIRQITPIFDILTYAQSRDEIVEQLEQEHA